MGPKRFAASTLAAVVLGWAVVQFAGSGMSAAQTMDHSNMPGMSAGAGAPNDPASKAYMDAMGRMQASMAEPMTGNPDTDFARGMIPHHLGAIDMAKVELQYGKDPELKKLAQEIIAAQEKEIAFLKDWLAKNGQ